MTNDDHIVDVDDKRLAESIFADAGRDFLDGRGAPLARVLGKYGEPLRGISPGVGVRSLSAWLLSGSVIELEGIGGAYMALRIDKRIAQTPESVMSGFREPGTGPPPERKPPVIRPTKVATAPKPIVPVVAGKGKWGVSESKSDFDDSRTVALTLAAENGVSGWLAKSTPVIVLRCQERKTELYVVTGMAASVEVGAVSRHTVRLRFDDAPALSVLASPSTDSKSLFIPNPVSTAKRMLAARTLTLGFTPFNANPAIVKFEVAGLAGAIGPLRESCGW